MMARGLVCNCALLLNLLACSPDRSATSSIAKSASPDPNLLQNISDRLNALEKQSAANELLDTYRGERIQMLWDAQESAALLTTESNSYAVARTSFGPFVLVCRSVTPYLDGFKVKLAIGNITSATFNGAKLKIGWALASTAESKSREVEVTTVFYPGAYSQVEVVLTPAKSQDVKIVSVGITVNVITLR